MSTPTMIIVLAVTNPACLFLGYLFGRLTRATVRIEENMETDDAPTPRPADDRGRRVSLMAIAVVVAVIGIGTAVTGVVILRNQDRLAGCIAGYSNASAAVTRERSAAQDVVNEQIDQFMQAVLEAFSATPADGRKKIYDAVQSYNEARTQAKETRKNNPLPDPPEDACTELTD